MKLFDDNRTYTTKERSEITGEPVATLRQKRWRGDDAKYLKLGARVYYPGQALNAYYASKLIDPAERRRALDAAKTERHEAQQRHRKAARRRRAPP